MTSLIDQYWFEIREGRPLFGLTDGFIEQTEGDWVAIELPDPGVLVRAGETFGFLTTDRDTHDLRAPMPLRVLAVNPRCAENPNLVRLSPRGEGWLLEIEPLVNQAVV